MTEATQINDNDLLMIVQNEKSKKVKLSTIKNQEYSTEEQVIGTWIDGKPIYRKVMSLQSSTAGEHLISFSDLNADFITIEDFYIKSGNSGYF